jgi:RNA polymerase sigma-70 factor (ECF subfamily)
MKPNEQEEIELAGGSGKPVLDEDYFVVQRVLGGQTADYKILQKKYQKIIASLIRRMVQNPDDVDDLTQETFIKAYNALKSFQPEYQFSRWLYRIASNTCIDFLRKKRLNIISIDQPVMGSEGEMQFEIPDADSPPDLSMISAERTKILKEALDELPEKYREIVRLRHEEELDYQQIADMLELPLGTVKAHLFRARKLLYKKLKKHIHHFEE